MSTDLTLPVRRAVVKHLTDNLTGIAVYGEQVPANPVWPFIRYASITTPFDATCWSGSDVRVSIHVFANGQYTDSVLGFAARVVEVMKTLDVFDVEWLGNVGPLQEADQSKWHVVVEFAVTQLE